MVVTLPWNLFFKHIFLLEDNEMLWGIWTQLFEIFICVSFNLYSTEVKTKQNRKKTKVKISYRNYCEFVTFPYYRYSKTLFSIFYWHLGRKSNNFLHWGNYITRETWFTLKNKKPQACFFMLLYYILSPEFSVYEKTHAKI